MDAKNVKMEVLDCVSRKSIMVDFASLNLAVYKYTQAIKRQTDFVGYAAASVSIFLALATSTFHDALGIRGYVWEALFIFCGVAAAFMTIRAAYNAWNVRNFTPETLITMISLAEESEKTTTKQF